MTGPARYTGTRRIVIGADNCIPGIGQLPKGEARRVIKRFVKCGTFEEAEAICAEVKARIPYVR